MTDTALATILARLDQFEADMNIRLGKFEADMNSRFTDVNKRLDKFEADVNARFFKIEAKLDEKPGIGTVYQVTFGTVLALCAFAIGMTGMFKATGIIP